MSDDRKLCRDCLWCKPKLVWASANPDVSPILDWDVAVCMHPKIPVSLVTGEPNSLCSDERKYLHYEDHGEVNQDHCGIDGLWWEPKDGAHE